MVVIYGRWRPSSNSVAFVFHFVSADPVGIREAWGLSGSCGDSRGAHGASEDPVGTREARIGPQRILWALGRRAWGLRGSCGDSGSVHGALADPVGTYIEVGAHEAFTARSMVTEPTEETGGDLMCLGRGFFFSIDEARLTFP